MMAISRDVGADKINDTNDDGRENQQTARTPNAL